MNTSESVGPFICSGRSKAFSARMAFLHEDTHLHPRCSVCGANLGCPRCSGPLDDLLCLGHGISRPHWGNPEAEAKHGLLEPDALTKDRERVRVWLERQGMGA
jgi:hypothetical protein